MEKSVYGAGSLAEADFTEKLCFIIGKRKHKAGRTA